MRERTTKRHLEFEIDRLNANTGNHYGLQSCNGATRIERDGHDITPLMTKRELFQVLRGINTVLVECKRRPAPGKEGGR